jgi:8-oxo-dGTP pyrophosphatase MutT (NUDIX family)
MSFPSDPSFPEKLKRRLQAALPGAEAQYRMAPYGRPRIDPLELKAGSYRIGAVMIVMCRAASGDYFIPLIERVAYEGVHGGQMALPGGKKDEDDGSLETTARRECAEETGIVDVDVIGMLTPLYIPVSGFLVHPFISLYYEEDPIFQPYEREVKSIVKLSLSELLRPDFVCIAEVNAGGKQFDAPCFIINGHVIWGATAMILNEFRQVVSEAKSTS